MKDRERKQEDMLDEIIFRQELEDITDEIKNQESFKVFRDIDKKKQNLVQVEIEDYKTGYIYYKKKYEEIRDASFWRMTEPLRKLVDYYQWKKNGVKKIQIADEMSDSAKRMNKKIEVGVHLHLFDLNYLSEICDYLKNIPERFDLYISYSDNLNKNDVERWAHKIENVHEVIVKRTINTRNDIAPFYVLFAKELIKYKYILHIHSNGALNKENCVKESLDGVLKSTKMVQEVLRLMSSEYPEVGLIFSKNSSATPLMALHWLQHRLKGEELLNKLHIRFYDSIFFYPVGNFFWAKTDAIRPLFDLGLSDQDFEQKDRESDDILADALERVIAFVVKNQKYDTYIYDVDTNTFSRNKDLKCFRKYFGYNSEKISKYLTDKYDVISFDVFDTLITRNVCETDDLFRLIERKIKKMYGRSVNFSKVRKQAEEIARKERGDSCNIHYIYERMSDAFAFSKDEIEWIKQLEIELEYKLCVPRRDMLEVFESLKKKGKKIVLVGDTSLTASIITRILDKCGYRGYDDLWISCEKGKSKAKDTVWDDFFLKYGDQKTIHIGADPYSDGKTVGDRGKDYFLLLSSMEQFRLSDQYEKFEEFMNTTVENALMLGYLINECLYNSPFALREDGLPRMKSVKEIANGIFAPVLLKYIDFLHKTSRKNTKLLFLSREGYFLEKLYECYCESFSKKELDHVYFLTSRRATSVAQIQCAADVEELFQTKYIGKISTLFSERFGLEDINIENDIDISLPQDQLIVMNVLLKHISELLQEVRVEKENYLKYITQILGQKIEWDDVTLVDVGYSGSIQYYLMKILETRLDGCYLASGYKMKPDILSGTYRSPYSFWRDKSFSDAQLFLEAVTAAPHGQVMKFEERNGKIEAILKKEKKLYGENAAQFQNEIFEYVRWMASLLKEIEPTFDSKLAERMFSEILRKGILDASSRGMFCVGDGYCSDGDWIFNEIKNAWEIRKEKV